MKPTLNEEEDWALRHLMEIVGDRLYEDKQAYSASDPLSPYLVQDDSALKTVKALYERLRIKPLETQVASYTNFFKDALTQDGYYDELKALSNERLKLMRSYVLDKVFTQLKKCKYLTRRIVYPQELMIENLWTNGNFIFVRLSGSNYERVVIPFEFYKDSEHAYEAYHEQCQIGDGPAITSPKSIILITLDDFDL